MTFSKSLALAAVLTGAAAGVQAEVQTHYYFLAPALSSQPADNLMTFAFSDPFDPARTPTPVVGDSFIDYFLFNTPDTRTLSFSARGGALFTGAHVAPAAFGSSPDFNFVSTLSSFAVGGGATLASGVYAFELAGRYTTPGGFSGFLMASPVPEPGGVALTLAALGVLGLLARRRPRR